MKLQLDNNLAPRLVGYLPDVGHDVHHIRDHRLYAAPDQQVLDFARAEKQALVTGEAGKAKSLRERPVQLCQQRLLLVRVHIGQERHIMILLTIDEAAERLHATPRFIRRLVAERRITDTKIGKFVRIPATEVDRFIASGLVEPLTRPTLD